MRKNIKYIPKIFAFCLLFSAFIGCKKADKFYQTLDGLPQIDNTHAYNSTYIVGDTLTITGKFQPANKLVITIGGVSATIVKTDSLAFSTGNSSLPAAAYKNQVGVLITTAMVGKGQTVSLTLNGNTITGSPVDIYSQNGNGSLTDSLKSTSLLNGLNSKNVFLYCENGLGDVYYYSATDKSLQHVKSDGTPETVFDLSKSIDPNTNVIITAFLAGGVDPKGRYLYFSLNTTRGYYFCKVDLGSKQLTILNQSTALGTPYEGGIGTVKVIVTGIYPSSGNTIYLAIGTGNGAQVPDAIGSFNTATAQLTYVYKKIPLGGTTYAGMPGTVLLGNGLFNIFSLRFSPDENLLYALEADAGSDGSHIEMFDLQNRVSIQQMSSIYNNASANLEVIAPFSALKIGLGRAGQNPDNSFGYLPMPGKRLQVLLYQFITGPGNGVINIAKKNGFPKWITFSFDELRTYTYAPGRFDQSSFIFQPTNGLSPSLPGVDQLLNYDAAGNLYMTANGKTTLIKTQAH